ncbi:hypothetical protein [Leyella stercorea]|uniref:hypothetical protein n=1 Tax=Leyella stercorea TaxID=363265 RepID=UPI003AF19A78
MKKIFTLFVALFCTVAMFAQDTKGMFEFADKDGNVVPNGSTLTKTEVEKAGTSLQINTGLFVKPVKPELNGEKLGAKLRVEVENIDHGTIKYCLLGSCSAASEKGTFYSISNFVEKLDDLATEWVMGKDKAGKALKGEATVKLTLVACKRVSLGLNDFGIEDFDWEEVGDCSSVTVKFIYDGTTAINGVTNNTNATVVARYAADGTRLSAPQKGLNIVKLSNGKTVKYIK